MICHQTELYMYDTWSALHTHARVYVCTATHTHTYAPVLMPFARHFTIHLTGGLTWLRNYVCIDTNHKRGARVRNRIVLDTRQRRHASSYLIFLFVVRSVHRRAHWSVQFFTNTPHITHAQRQRAHIFQTHIFPHSCLRVCMAHAYNCAYGALCCSSTHLPHFKSFAKRIRT